MRRDEKSVSDPSEIEEIMQRGEVCRLAMCTDNTPYLVPMNYGYRDSCIYLHAATEGKKIDILKKNPRVWFEVTGRREIVPEHTPCAWGMRYECVMGNGMAEIVADREEKETGLQVIMNHYADKQDWQFAQTSLDSAVVIKIRIGDMTVKRSGVFE